MQVCTSWNRCLLPHTSTCVLDCHSVTCSPCWVDVLFIVVVKFESFIFLLIIKLWLLCFIKRLATWIFLYFFECELKLINGNLVIIFKLIFTVEWFVITVRSCEIKFYYYYFFLIWKLMIFREFSVVIHYRKQITVLGIRKSWEMSQCGCMNRFPK